MEDAHQSLSFVSGLQLSCHEIWSSCLFRQAPISADWHFSDQHQIISKFLFNTHILEKYFSTFLWVASSLPREGFYPWRSSHSSKLGFWSLYLSQLSFYWVHRLQMEKGYYQTEMFKNESQTNTWSPTTGIRNIIFIKPSRRLQSLL